MNLTDEQWEILTPLIPEHPPRPDGRGRPRMDENWSFREYSPYYGRRYDEKR